MTPLTYLYVAGFTLLVACAAAAIEWALQGRAPARHIWTGAIALVLIVPTVAIVWTNTHPRTIVVETPATQIVQATNTIVAPGGARAPVAARSDARYSAADLVRTAVASIPFVWGIASLGLVVWILSSVLRWRREQRQWSAATLDGVPVHLSQSTGPAVLGVISQRIVIPEWALSLPADRRALVLAHEREHVEARDPQRLAFAVAALIVMPWNLALLWCVARLRRAVEVDCDQRVLQKHPRVKDYGYLLLDVAARSRGSSALALPMVAMLTRRSELELRIRAMTRSGVMRRRTAAIGGLLATVAITAAFAAPVPGLTRIVHRAAEKATRPNVSERVETTAPKTTVYRDTIVHVRDSMMVLHGDSVLVFRRHPGDTADVHFRMMMLDTSMHASHMRMMSSDSNARVFFRRMSDSAGVVHMRMLRSEGDSGLPRMSIDDPRVAVELATGMAQMRSGMQHMMRGPMRFPKVATEDIEHALEKYYPDVAGDPSASGTVSFVADSAGNVIETHRSATVQGERTWVPATDGSGYQSIQIQRGVMGHKNLTVIWIQRGDAEKP